VTARTVRLRLPDGTELAGPVVDLRDADADVSPAAVHDAIRFGCPTRPGRPTVHAPPPTRVHAHVGHLTPGASVDRRAALAAVGAATGIDTPHDADLAAVKASLRAVSVPAVDDAELRAARRRAAEAGSETDRLRERVATLRGRVAARREDGADDAAAEAEASLSEATRTLSEASTERVAATQRLATLEERARRARDAREERLRLEDRAGNLRRARRAALADAVASEFREARARIGSVLDARPATGPDAGLRDALAVAAVAPLRAPVVVAPDVVTALGGSDAAFERLDVPLVIG
jgi:hypothetical protein